MVQQWGWQQANWPNWSFDQAQVLPCLLSAPLCQDTFRL